MLSDKTYLKIMYFYHMKKRLNFENVTTFNEKLQWLKLYYFPNNELVVRCTDKYAVREYIKGKGYENILVPLIGVWNRTEMPP